MARFRFLPLLAVSVLPMVHLTAGRVTFADDRGNTPPNVNEVRNFVDKAKITLMDAIRKAEPECGGTVIHAEAMCDHDHRDSVGLKADHYKVCCLKDNKLVAVCIDSESGAVLATHELKTLPFGIRSPSDSTRIDIRAASKTAMRFQKSTDLIGKPVQNPQGERLGEIQDLAVDMDRGGRVVYAVLSFGGFLGLGEKWFAIPTGALTLPDHAKYFVLAVEKDRLKNAVGFEKDRWPRMGDATWATGVHEFYGQRPYWIDKADSTAQPSQRIHKATEIIGRSVRNGAGENLGDIKDLAIDPDAGRIIYVVLSFGGVLGMGDKLFAVPPSVMQFDDPSSPATLRVDKERLKLATGFDKSRWPNLADPTFNSAIYEFYGQEPYWVEVSRDKSRP